MPGSTNAHQCVPVIHISHIPYFVIIMMLHIQNIPPKAVKIVAAPIEYRAITLSSPCLF